MRFYQEAQTEYSSKADKAKAMSGASGKIASENAADVAAWAAVGNILLNLDETLMKP